MTIETHAYARAGFLGNPSDGYYGKTITVAVKNFSAHVTLEPSARLRIEAAEGEPNTFPGVHELVERIDLHGYYGGERLIMAAIKVFAEFCETCGAALEGASFTIRFRSDIPRQVGLAGSSAIVTATMRALMAHYEVAIPREILPTLILNAELKELGINAGLMDRVAQVFEGCAYMDLDRKMIEEKGHGAYESLNPTLLPNLYVAYNKELGKVSGQVLNTIREGYDRGDENVIGTLNRIASLAEEGRKALLSKDYRKLHDLMNENFDLRSKIMPITDRNRELVETARRCGASAKFAGSGGSIIGIYEDEAMYNRLSTELSGIRAEVIKPQVV